jgi:hypothetical protein
MTDPSSAPSESDPAPVGRHREWRPGSRRYFAYSLKDRLTSKHMVLWMINEDGPNPDNGRMLAEVQAGIERFGQAAVAAGYIDAEQATAILESDVGTASQVVKSAIWDFETDPACAVRDRNGFPDWSMDWPAAPADEPGAE